MMFHTTRYVRVNENESIEDCEFVILGVPFDSTETSIPGQRLAPDEIRKKFLEIDVASVEDKIYDAGNVIVVHGNIKKTLENATKAISEIYGKNDKVKMILLGGEHTISYAGVKFFSKRFDTIQLVWFDAHGDAYNTYLGEKWSHATVLKRISELKNVKIFPVGVRAETEGLKSIKTHEIDELDEHMPTYISIDMDVFDPSLIKGVSDPVPDGVKSFDEIIDVLKGIRNKVCVDIVEVNPLLDSHITPSMAAWLMLKIMELWKI